MAGAFAPAVNSNNRATSALNVVTDPSVVTKKEYEDICGVSFDEETLMKRLENTAFLYPKHVEVIKDIAPIAGAMVDEVVSQIASLQRQERVLGSSLRVGVEGDVSMTPMTSPFASRGIVSFFDQTHFLILSFRFILITASRDG